MNTYSVLYNDRKVTLQSMKIHDFDHPASEDRILTLKGFSQSSHDRGIIFALIIKATIVLPTVSEPLPEIRNSWRNFLTSPQRSC